MEMRVRISQQCRRQLKHYAHSSSKPEATSKHTSGKRTKKNGKKLEPTAAKQIIRNHRLYMLPNTVRENRQWERCLTRLRIGHIKLTHGPYMSREQPPTCEDCGEDTPITIKHILGSALHLTIEDVNSLALLTKL